MEADNRVWGSRERKVHDLLVETEASSGKWAENLLQNRVKAIIAAHIAYADQHGLMNIRVYVRTVGLNAKRGNAPSYIAAKSYSQRAADAEEGPADDDLVEESPSGRKKRKGVERIESFDGASYGNSHDRSYTVEEHSKLRAGLEEVINGWFTKMGGQQPHSTGEAPTPVKPLITWISDASINIQSSWLRDAAKRMSLYMHIKTATTIDGTPQVLLRGNGGNRVAELRVTRSWVRR
jgi:hypothetical protein